MSYSAPRRGAPLRKLIRAVVALVMTGILAVTLSSCTGFRSDDGSSEVNVEQALTESDLPLTNIEAISFMDGFERKLEVHPDIDRDELTHEELITLLTLTAQNIDSRTHGRLGFVLLTPGCRLSPRAPGCGRSPKNDALPVDEVNAQWSEMRGDEDARLLGSPGHGQVNRVNRFLEELEQ